jgi:chorismate synthase
MVKNENIDHIFASRSDPTICTRLYPVCEAMTRIAILDAIYMADGYRNIMEAVDPRWDRL